ncbi:MAG TPA: hypothetical protein VHX36_06185 [Candidatus Acidoferrales bacterium]|nr:hypothetical protein [Candidatus Acidoferrales bacterium]
MKKRLMQGALMIAAASILAAGTLVKKAAADDDHDRFANFDFVPDTLVLSRSVYLGTASTVMIGETLPLGCAGGANGSTNVNVPLLAGGTTPVNVPCGIGSDNGEAPNLFNSHNVWNNANSDGSFGVTSPIILDDLTTDGQFLGSLFIPTGQMVTSFSSKSELALNRSIDGKSLTFMGYQSGPGCGGYPVSPTAPNLLDVSASNTPGVCDPTNPVITTYQSGSVVPTAYYRAVAEVDAHGHLSITDGNAYSGDNGRAAIKGGNGLYYMVGNDNSGNLSKKQIPLTQDGVNLYNATGAELLVPGQAPPAPPNITMVGRLEIGTDKLGKDTNFRGLTIFNNTLYISKGSGSNGINTVYQVGTSGTLPAGSAANLATVPIAVLPGFPNTTDSTNTSFPFGMFFANASTLYVCDEGDGTLVSPPVNGNVADAQSLATAGVQKWVLESDGNWHMLYVLQDGLNIGVPYGVPGYPASLDPATGGCRNMTGRVNGDGTVDIFAITSTISTNGDQGADPNKLVKVTDILSANTLPAPSGNPFWGRPIGLFRTLRTARAGEVFRGVAFAPEDRGDADHGRR